MSTPFPQSKSKYLKGVDFQDREITLTFKDWKRKANEDEKDASGKLIKSWKDKIKYTLRYSFPEWAMDTVTGEKRIGRDGHPYRNRYWDAQFPYGYTIVYSFVEGELESGSLPLFDSFCRLQPKAGEKLVIKRTGVDKETKWFVTKLNGSVHPSDVPEINVNDLNPDDENIPF